MATESPSPKSPEPCGFSSGLPLWGWALLGMSVVVVLVGLLIWEPYYDAQQSKLKLEELERSFGPGAVDPDPDWMRRIEEINESQRSVYENRAKDG
jgi:hypothetical protein